MDRRLKILFLTNRSPFPMKDGQTRRTYNILKGLAEKHEVFLLSLYEEKEEINPDRIEHLKGFCENVEMHASPLKKLSFSMTIRFLRSLISKYPYTIWRHYSRSYLKRIHELIKNGEFDLIHCDILSLAYTVRNLKTLPCTITDHDVSYLKALRMAKQINNILIKLLLFLEAYKLKRLENKVFEEVDVGIVVSELDKKLLNKLCPRGKFEVIENGVDIEKFKPNSESTDYNSLLWIGGFDHYPNREGINYFLKKIYPLIKEQLNDDVKLYVIGDGVTNKLKKLACKDSSIKILGFVDNPLTYIQKASVFIAPLLSGGGTKLKVLEAMAVGKAIATTKIGCEGIEGKDKEHYIVADTPEEFAESVIELLNDQNIRKYLGNNARKLAEEKYDWRIICKKMDIIYSRLSQNNDSLQENLLL